MSKFSKASVVTSIRQIYSTSSSSLRSSSDQHLKSFQNSFESWEIVSQIFQSDEYEEPVYLFTAITLKKKLSFDFEEVKQLDPAGFQQNLLSLCSRFSLHAKVLRQLSLCVGLLSIHLAYSWGGSILQDIESLFKDNVQGFLIMIEGLAEELQDKDVVVDHDKLVHLKGCLQGNGGKVFEFIFQHSENVDLAINVFVAWAHSEVSCALPNIWESQLFAKSFEMIESYETADKGFKVLSEIVNLSEESRSRDLVMKLMATLMACWGKVRGVMKDMEAAEACVRLYCSFAGFHLKTLLEEENFEFFAILTEMFGLRAVGVTGELTKFWHKALKMFARIDCKAEFKERFKQIIHELMSLSIVHFKVNELELRGGIGKDSEEIRTDLAILLENIADVVCCSAIASMVIAEISNKLQINGLDIGSYCELEALVSCLGILVPLCDEEFFNLFVIKTVLDLTRACHPYMLVNSSICQLVSSCTYELNSETINQICRYLKDCLDQGLPSYRFSSTFKQICEINSDLLVYDCTVVNEIYCISRSLPDEDVDVVLEGASLVYWQMPINEGLLPSLSYFTSLLNPENPESLLTYASDKIGLMIKVSSTHKSIQLDPVFQVLSSLWPILKSLLLSTSSTFLIESLCRIINNSIRKLNSGFEPFLSDLLPLITLKYSQNLSSPFLYTAETLIKYMPQTLSLSQDFLNLFISISAITINSFKSQPCLTQDPEMIEDFYGMCCKFIRTFAYNVLDLDVFVVILETSMLSIGICEIQAGRCLYKFLLTSFEAAVESLSSREEVKEKVSGIINKFKDILNLLLKVIIQVVPAGLFDSVQDLMYSIISSQYGYQWVQVSLASIPHDCLTTEEKQKFLSSVLYGLDLYSWIKKLHKRSKRRSLRQL